MDATGERSGVLRVTTMPFETLDRLTVPTTSRELADRHATDRRLAAEAASLGEELFALAGRPEAAGPAGAARRNAVLALRRDLHRGRITEHAGSRLDLLPPPLSTRVTMHGASRTRHAAAIASVARTFEAELLETERALIATMTTPHATEGLRLAGRALLDKVRRAAATDPAAWRHGERQAIAKAVAYFARFTTKTSPNGFFCATAHARFAGDMATVAGENRIRVEVRLGVGEARKVTACLAVDPVFEPHQVVTVNPTLRRRPGGGWTFWKTASSRNADDTEVRSEVPDHPVLAAFLAEAQNGTLATADLIRAAAARSGLDPGAAEVQGFFRRLLAIGILDHEVWIPWSSWRPLRDLAAFTRRVPVAPEWLAEAGAIECQVDGLATLDPAARVAALDPLAARIEALPHARPIARDDLFRADAATAFDVTLPETVLDPLARFVASYARFYSALYPAPLYRAGHVRRFLARFAADTDVEALDLYHGVFEPDPQARPTAFPEPRRSARSPDREAARRAFHELRDELVRRARAADGEEIVLAGDDWSGLLRDLPPTPAYSCGLLFQIGATDPAAIGAGRWRAAINAIYPGGGFSVSRLASLHAGDDRWVEAELARGHRWLERSGAVLAEVSSMHGGRTANAGLRPPLLAHEIVLPGDHPTPGKVALPLADLVVRFDAASAEFELRSKAHGCRVVPVVSSGISTEGFLSFLVEVGRQGVQPLAYFPGFDVEDMPVWPRVRCGNVVLFRRRWRCPAGEVPGAGARRIDFARFAEVARWREDLALPRRVFVHTSVEPKPFFVDFAAPLLVEQMLRAIPIPGAEPATVHLTEMLPSPDELWLRDAAGRYASEFLVHFAHPAQFVPPAARPAFSAETAR